MSNSSDAFTDEEIVKLRKETRGCTNVVHLNNAGAGLMPDVVTQSMLAHLALEADIGGYEAAARQADAVRDFYVETAKLINAKPSNIAFTTSATDAYTRALSAIPFRAGDIILTTQDDFISNQIQFLSCRKRFGVRIEYVSNATGGGVDLADLENKMKLLKPRLLAVTHIPTNSGLVQPVHAIGEIASRHDAWYILDACQSIGQMKLDVAKLKCDFLSVTCRKFLRGPRGTGFLYISDRALSEGLEPLFIDMRGAEWIEKDVYQPRADAMRFEDWEFAYAQVLGTREAIAFCRSVGEDRIWQRVKYLSDYMRERLNGLSDKLRVLDRGPEVGALVTFHIKDFDPLLITRTLAQRKINVVPSYRNFAVMDFDEKQVPWAIRASPHYYNTREEVDLFIEAVAGLVRVP